MAIRLNLDPNDQATPSSIEEEGSVVVSPDGADSFPKAQRLLKQTGILLAKTQGNKSPSSKEGEVLSEIRALELKAKSLRNRECSIQLAAEVSAKRFKEQLDSCSPDSELEGQIREAAKRNAAHFERRLKEIVKERKELISELKNRTGIETPDFERTEQVQQIWEGNF